MKTLGAHSYKTMWKILLLIYILFFVSIVKANTCADALSNIDYEAIVKRYKADEVSEFSYESEKNPKTYIQAARQVREIYKNREDGAKKAILATLEHYEEANKPVPTIMSPEIDQNGVSITDLMIYEGLFSEHWLKQLEDNNEKLPRVGSKTSLVSISQIPRQPSRALVYLIRTKAGVKVMRPAIKYIKPGTMIAPFREQGRVSGNINVVRKTVLSSRINDDLKANFVPKTEVVALFTTKFRKPIIASISDFAIGEPVESDWFFTAIEEAPELYSDYLAFEFLVGQVDGNNGNTWTRRKRVGGLNIPDVAHGITAIDHEYALVSGLTGGFGMELPPKYTKSFMKKLKTFSPKIIKSNYSRIATPAEIEGLIFRRDILLEDASIKGLF